MQDFFGIFDDQGAVLTFFGALGGAVRSAVLKTTWREGVRVVFIGSATAFGLGVLGPKLMRPWIGDLPDGVDVALGTLGACAFMVGLIAVTLTERLIAGKSVKGEGDDV